jgi:phosphatidylglycerophosphatase C
MGSSQPESQPPEKRPLVAFDFDGTLTVKDSFTAFLMWNAGPAARFRVLSRLAPALIDYAARRDRGRLKAKAIKALLPALTRPDLARAAEAFAEARMAALMRPDAMACWQEWRKKGAILAIVSASPEDLLRPFARRLGADCLIGTRLKWDDDGLITDQLDGANCRGPEKRRRLMDQFGTGRVLAAAYGDTAGDREMLAMAQIRGYRVFKGRP